MQREGQIVAIAPSWVANDTLTEAQTRRLEPDERIWKREYAAIPQVGGASVFPVDLIDAAFERWKRYTAAKPATHYLVLDPSSGGSTSADWFTFGAFGWVDNSDDRFVHNADGSIRRTRSGECLEWPGFQPDPPVLKFMEIDGLQGGFFGKVGGDDIARRIGRLGRRYAARFVFSDQREQFFLESTLKKERLKLQPIPWTATSKPQAVEVARRWFADGLIALPPHERLRSELLGFEEKITATGQLTYGARRGGHDDFVALLITAAHAELASELRQSPIAPRPTYALLQE